MPQDTNWLGVVASSEECEAALFHLAARFTEVDEEVRRRHASDRTISCRIPDLGVIYSGRLRVEASIQDLWKLRSLL